jgi:hypothetical protein
VACSYHLRLLAKYGFVEPDPASAADARNRPWRARATQVRFPGDPDRSTAAKLAAQLLTDQVYARSSTRRAQYLADASQYSPPWQSASDLTEAAVYVTRDELESFQSELQDLLRRYRRAEPGGRPAGARRVSVLLDLIPWFAPDGEDPPAGGSR